MNPCFFSRNNVQSVRFDRDIKSRQFVLVHHTQLLPKFNFSATTSCSNFNI